MMDRSGNAGVRAIRVVVAASCFAAGAAGSAVAQAPNPGQVADAYASGAKANAALMQKYTWKMRVQLTYKGDAKPASLYQMNYVNGQLQKTEISEQEGGGRKHGIKHRKEDEIKADVNGLIELTKKYMAPTPGQMFDFYSKATISPAPGGAGMQVAGANFIQPGDKATFIVDPATKSPTSFNFSSTFNNNPVTGTAQYAQVPGGPKYASQLTVNDPSDNISVQVTNFDYQLNQ